MANDTIPLPTQESPSKSEVNKGFMAQSSPRKVSKHDPDGPEIHDTVSTFGAGELDGYEFSEDITQSSVDYSRFTNKENMAPATSSDPLAFMKKMPSPKRVTRKGRSKSIGPGALEQGDDSLKKAAKDRRKSAFVPATKSILSKNEDAEKEARRKTMNSTRSRTLWG